MKKKFFLFIIFLIITISVFGQEILLQQNDVELKDFITSIGKMLKINFILPQNLSGRVNIISYEKIKTENIFQIIETILNQNNYTLKKEEGYYLIVPVSDVARSTTYYNIEELKKVNEGYITSIIELKYLNINKIPQILGILQVLTSKYGIIRNYENYIIITDLIPNIQKVKEVIELFDNKDKEIVYKIIKLNNSTVINLYQRIIAILNGMKSIGQKDYKYSLIPYEATNSLILISTEDDINTIEQIIKQLDEEYKLENIFKVFQLNYSSSADIIKQLKELLSSGSLAGDEKDIITKTKIFEDERRNAIIVSTNSYKIIEIIDNYLKTADTEAVKPNELIKVFELENITKEDMVKVLKELLNSMSVTLKNEAQSTSITAIPNRKAIIVSTPSYIIMDKIKNIVKEVDVKSEKFISDIQIYKLKNSQAKSIAETLNKLDFKQLDPNKKEEINLKIVPVIETNSLIITGEEKYFNKISEIIKELDIERKQVLINAIIAEVSLDATKSLGVEWIGSGRIKEDYYGFATSNEGVVNKEILLNQGAKAAAMALSGMSVGIFRGDATDISAIINLQKKDAKFNILSTPQILTLDNKEATINVGNEVPFLTHSRITDNNNTIRSFEYKNVGINLRIIPHINESGNITLEIKQEIKNLTENTVFDAPVVNTREITTEVLVQDNYTVVIGGLIKEDKTETIQKVPILGDLPLIGFLFKRKTTGTNKTNLLVFINPKVIKEINELERISEENKDKFESSKKTILK